MNNKIVYLDGTMSGSDWRTNLTHLMSSVDVVLKSPTKYFFSLANDERRMLATETEDRIKLQASIIVHCITPLTQINGKEIYRAIIDHIKYPDKTIICIVKQEFFHLSKFEYKVFSWSDNDKRDELYASYLRLLSDHKIEYINTDNDLSVLQKAIIDKLESINVPILIHPV